MEKARTGVICGEASVPATMRLPAAKPAQVYKLDLRKGE
jgi:hypothetical protein